MKISTALEININSTSSTDTGEGTNDFKKFSEFYQKKLLFVLKLADQLLCNSRNLEKKRQKTFTKHRRNSKRLEKNGEQMKRQLEVIREPKTGIRLLLIKFKSYPHLRCYDFSLRYMSFLAFAVDNSSCFYSWLSSRGLS